MKEITLYYDGECPICQYYSLYLELRAKYKINLFNIREFPAKIKEFQSFGYNANEGMILYFEGNIYHGDQALYQLNKLTQSQGYLEQIVSKFLENSIFVQLIYPLIKWFRWILLKLLGVKRIN